MPNLSKAQKAAQTRAANKAAKLAAQNAPATQAAAPAPDAPAPADVIQSARAKRQATVDALLAAGAHKPNVRNTTSVRIPLGLPKYDFSHLASKSIAARVAGLPAGSQAFYLQNARAFAGRTIEAEQLDNAKLARCITAGLATATGGQRDGTHLTGGVFITFADLPKA